MLRIRGMRSTGEETGAALILVVGVGAVLAMLMSMLVVVSVNGMRQARSDADWNAALAAAYAAVDEYQSRLSADTSYYRFGDSTAPFSSGSTLTAPPAANAAFGVGAGGSWADVAGSDGRAQFRYEVDNSKYASTGRIRIRATGRVGAETRSIIADLKQQGFIDFLYFTDYEVQDPDVAGVPATSCYTDSTKTTLKYAWGGRSGSCNEITFAASDVLAGPVHSNDTIRTCGSRFKGVVTTANNKTPLTVNASGCSAATFEIAGSPGYSGGVIGMPATNSELKKETRTDLTATDVPRPGCLYTGPTQFEFFSNGTVNIKSPYTKYTRIGDAAATTVKASTPPECGTIAALTSAAGATITVPDNNVIYVQNVPAVTTDANYWASSAKPTGFTCVTSPAESAGWTFGGGGYPAKTGTATTTEIAPSSTTYGCRSGDVFVKGTFKGAMTLSAENYVFVVGDVKYADVQNDILGLVGNNAIWVYNPFYKNGSATGPILTKDRTIQAAILSVAHTFQVQNYNTGPSNGSQARGTLTVFGAIAQKYRGTVATGTSPVVTGYVKNYVYDERFKYKAPPKFLNPVTTTYGVTTWVETAAAWRPDGAAR